jgi:tellurium resistance protein TerD
MAVNLVKGQKVDLTKGNPGLNKLVVGLGWDTNRFDGSEFDLDAMAFMLDGNKKAQTNNNFIYFNHKKNDAGAVILTGDNRTGAGEGDDEQLIIDLNKVPAGIESIAVCINIYEAAKRKQNFGMVDNAYVRVVNEATGEELSKYDLTEDFSAETAVMAAEIYRHEGEWKFKAIGEGLATLEKLVEKVGL